MILSKAQPEPVHLFGLSCLPYLRTFFFDSVKMGQQLVARHGRFVVLNNPVAISRMPHRIVFAAEPEIHKQVLCSPKTWRTINIGAGGKRNHASRRVNRGLLALRGKRHAHYRTLLSEPLHPRCIKALYGDMTTMTQAELAAWPIDEQVDLRMLTHRMMVRLSAALLFGGESDIGRSIARSVDDLSKHSWSIKSAIPLDLPGTAYRRLLRDSEQVEQAIIRWANEKKACPINEHDLLSVLAHSPDENGRPPRDEDIAGQVPFLFGAAYETCQNGLIWTLLMLTSHPGIAAQLREEIDSATQGEVPRPEVLNELPFLDWVVKEGQRLFPPVPQLFRVAQHATELNGAELPFRSQIILSALETNRREALYDQPYRFLPERWETTKASPFECLVFSGGQHTCPGKSFGNTVLKTTLAAIVQRFDLILPDRVRIDYRVNITINPRNVVPVVLKHRDGTIANVNAGDIRGSIRRLVQF